MLRITRKPGQAIQIGDDIVIHILEGTGQNIKVGVDAPETLKIWRLDDSDNDEVESELGIETVNQISLQPTAVAVG